MIRKIFILFFILFLLVLIFRKENYQIKVELKAKNLSAKFIDENISNPLKEDLLNISKIRDIVSFSQYESLNLYINLPIFLLNKNELLSKIEEKINSFSYKNPYIQSVKINKDYALKYQYFFIVYDSDYLKLKSKADEIYQELLNMKAFRDIKILGEQQIANNIYFKYENLINFGIDISDIKELIKKNNLISNASNLKINMGFSGNIGSIEDLKNIEISYKNADFSQKLSNIFLIKEELKEPTFGQIFYHDKYAIVFALSKKNCFLNLIKLNALKNKYNAIFEPIYKRKKVEIFLDENNILKTIEFYKKLRGDNLYFIGLNSPNNDKFEQNMNNRIIVYCNKKDFSDFKKSLIENNVFYFDKSSTFFVEASGFDNLKNKFKFFSEYINLGTFKILKPYYDFNFQNLSKFQFKKEDIINSIFAYEQGLVLDEYKKNGDNIQIILKNNEKNNFVYSKKYKNLFDVNLFLKRDLIEDFEVIARKNFKYFGIFKSKTLLF